MKIEKTVIVPAVPETTDVVVDYYRCDLCDRQTKDTENWKGESTYEIDNVVVLTKTGSSYPEGGHIEVTKFDICPDCFKNKLIPWMAKNGASPRTSERDW